MFEYHAFLTVYCAMKTLKRKIFSIFLLKIPGKDKYMCACSVVSSLRSLGLWPTKLLCSWNSLGKNTGVGCHYLLQGIFLTQGLNPGLLSLLHWQADSLPLNHLGSKDPEVFV